MIKKIWFNVVWLSSLVYASQTNIPSISYHDLGFPNLEGQAFTLSELDNLINNAEQTLQIYNTDLKKFTTKFSQPYNAFTQQMYDALQQRYTFFKQATTIMKPYLFWWQTIPCVGLRLEEPFWPISYPYLPHAFALWQLAPRMGKGQEVFLIDTGIAAFALDNKEFYKKHQDLQMLADFSKERYNFVAHTYDALDPFEQLVEIIMNYTDKTEDNENRIRKKLPHWIHLHAYEHSAQEIKEYLCTYGCKNLWVEHHHKRHLTEEGKRALREILQGEQGITPKHYKGKRYTPTNVYHPNNQYNVILEFLPTAPIVQSNLDHMKDKQKSDAFFSASYESGHGSHSAGIVSGLLHSYKPQETLTTEHIMQWLRHDSGVCGIAPQSELIMLKALRSDGGLVDRETITRALTHALKLDADIVNLSLKVDNRLNLTAPDVLRMKDALEKIPYSVISSGNATGKDDKVSIESYPAKFSCVSFDVGAFALYQDKNGDYHCPILEISQYQERVGPKFVMPGHNILSCGLVPNQQEDSMYVFMRGTSCSAPIISGFLTLLLAEFKGCFKNERTLFLKVCYSSAFKMESSDDWNKKVLLGALDMRTALFVLHVLKKISNHTSLMKHYPFEDYSDHYIKAIHILLESMVVEFACTYNISASFKHEFMPFFNQVRKIKHFEHMQQDIFISPEKAYFYISNILATILLPSHKQKMPTHVTNEVQEKIQAIFKKKRCNLFEDYPDSIQKRLKDAYK